MRYLAAHLLGTTGARRSPSGGPSSTGDKSPAELVDDAEAIGELEPEARSRNRGRARSCTHSAFPVQEHKLERRRGLRSATGRKAGEILELDGQRLRLVRGPILEDVPLPRALIPGGPFDTKPQRELVRLARAMDRYPALESILRRERPRAGREVLQTVDLDEMKRLVLDLERSHLVVRGRPAPGRRGRARG